MSDDLFERALDRVLEHEGGLVDHPNDPGGITNRGISLRWLRSVGEDLGDIDGDGDVDADDIRAVELADAQRLYRTAFWLPLYDDMAALGLAGSAMKVFDLHVVSGPRQAHKILQRALRATLPSYNAELVDDGAIGPASRKAIKNVAALALADPCLEAVLRAEAAGFFRSLAAQKPNLKVFLRGWLNRAYS